MKKYLSYIITAMILIGSMAPAAGQDFKFGGGGAEIPQVFKNKVISSTENTVTATTADVSLNSQKLSGHDSDYFADKSYVDGQIGAITGSVALKADKTYVDSQDGSLAANLGTHESLINTKAATAYVNGLAAAIFANLGTHETLINTKADKSYVDSQDNAIRANLGTHETLINTKADKTYVDGSDSVIIADAAAHMISKIAHGIPNQTGNAGNLVTSNGSDLLFTRPNYADLNKISVVSPLGVTNTFADLQTAFDSIPAATDSISVRRVYTVLIPAGTYDTDLTINFYKRKIAVVSVGAVNIGQFNGSNWSASGTPRNVTITVSDPGQMLVSIDSIRSGISFYSINPNSEGISTHQSYNNKLRISGNLIASQNGLGSTTGEFYFEGEVFGNLDTTAYAGNLNSYIKNARIKGTTTGATLRLTATNTRFDGLASISLYNILDRCEINAGMTVTGVGADFNTTGMFNSYFSGTFTGPANSFKVDGTTNNIFMTNGGSLAGGATKNVLLKGSNISNDSSIAGATISDAINTLAAIAGDTTAISLKADKTYVDDQDSAITASVALKADKSYVDGQDGSLAANLGTHESLINTKADKTYVDSKDGALFSNLGTHETLINTKADKIYVDSTLETNYVKTINTVPFKTYVRREDFVAKAEGITGPGTYSIFKFNVKSSDVYPGTLDVIMSGLEMSESDDFTAETWDDGGVARLQITFLYGLYPSDRVYIKYFK